MERSEQAVEESTSIHDASALSELELLVMIMQRGAKMLKIDRKSRGSMKTFILDEDHLGFRYHPTSKNNRIDIQSIKNVSLTPSVSSNNMGKYNLSNENCFTVECENRNPLIVVATEKHIAQCWVRGLKLLRKRKDSTDNSLSPRTKWLFEKFENYDKNNSGVMEFKELVNIVATLNIPMTKSHLMEKFQEFNTKGEQYGKNSGLTKAEFAEFFESLSKRKDIEETVMKQYSSNRTYLTSQELLEFLKTEQGMTNATEKDAECIVNSFESVEEWKSRKWLGVDGFASYLLSKEGDLFNPFHDTVYQDMTQPLAHYFIFSSHNTYLKGDQIKGQASVKAYVDALNMGCRCVELDCWDGADGEPVIFHGHTLVNKIYFKDVIEAINEHAFVTSPYPLILSLENHCGIPVQEKMARYLKEYLGDKLYIGTVDTKLEALPSPECFKNKIIVKGKKLKSKDLGDDDVEAGEISEEEEDDFDDDEGNNVTGTSESVRSRAHETKEKVTLLDSIHLVESSFKFEKKDKKPVSQRKLMKLAPALSKMVNYCTAIRFINFAKSQSEGKFYEMSSFGENKTKKFVKAKREAFVEYNKRQLSRIYPAGSRINSSNYNPQIAWSAGCQIVALNLQTEGAMMDLYLGKFRQNGNSGYILKPQQMRTGGIAETINKIQTLTVKIISGQQFPKVSGNAKGEIIDPYVVVALYGISEEKQVVQTKVVNNNGFNPCWDETFEFKVKNPELAILRFSVYDHDVGVDDFIGQFTIPFTSIRQVSYTACGYCGTYNCYKVTGGNIPTCNLTSAIFLSSLVGTSLVCRSFLVDVQNSCTEDGAKIQDVFATLH